MEDPSLRTDQDLSAFRQGVKTLRELASLFGLFLQPPQEKTGGDDELVGKLLDLMVQLRTDARAEKNFAMADKVRNSLADLGITLEDRKEGTAWRLP